MDNTIFYVLGLVAVIYIALSVFNKKRSKERKSRKFMEGYERKNKKD
ncbi:hypothetical protein ACA086_06905 [Muriicola sp. E247]|nr:hypothetical protein [Muriicola sp.]MBT8289551.1 hypothetical protein [Muriicola sp.]NNC61794.1 hypothetical protein [Eudoraea sp.]NNK34744.1 hypothetical protein [Eudoraea sp.]NNL39309.1 hypothetical protein [Flavobacteriaceae bacterium]